MTSIRAKPIGYYQPTTFPKLFHLVILTLNKQNYILITSLLQWVYLKLNRSKLLLEHLPNNVANYLQFKN